MLDCSENSVATLVPPRRLGRLLSTARAGQALTLQEASARAGITAADLDAIEHGLMAPADPVLSALAALYDAPVSTLVPARARLVIDFEERELAIGDERESLGRWTSQDEMLMRYLALVYRMRHVKPGRPVAMRGDDLETLATAFGASAPDVHGQLHSLMGSAAAQLEHRCRSLRHRVLFPALGILVGAVGMGAILMVTDDPAPTPAGALQGQVRIGDALLIER